MKKKLQDFWQAHYQILSIIVLKKLMKLNVNMDMIMKNVKLVKLYTKKATVFLNRQILKKIL